MKISNKQEVKIALYLFLFIILLDVMYFIFASKIVVISQQLLYSSFLVVLLFSTWRIVKLKVFSMEVSEHIFSVKYRHPLLRLNNPVLEVPIQKVVSLRTEKAFINYILIISINTKRGIRNFYYRIGQLPENQNEKFNQITNLITSQNNDDQIYKAFIKI